MAYTKKIGHAYFFAKNYIISRGYWSEIQWQDSMSYAELTEQQFLEETAWVILASGMSDKIVQKKFPEIKTAMLGFSSPKLIQEYKDICFGEAIRIFNHAGKINAILHIAEELAINSFEAIKALIERFGIEYLKTLPYIGEATAYHLAKNIGLNVAKPDRHLLRIALALGFESPDDLCKQISEELQEKIALVDLVIWRYATLDKRYLEKIDRVVRK